MCYKLFKNSYYKITKICKNILLKEKRNLIINLERDTLPGEKYLDKRRDLIFFFSLTRNFCIFLS